MYYKFWLCLSIWDCGIGIWGRDPHRFYSDSRFLSHATNRTANRTTQKSCECFPCNILNKEYRPNPSINLQYHPNTTKNPSAGLALPSSTNLVNCLHCPRPQIAARLRFMVFLLIWLFTILPSKSGYCTRGILCPFYEHGYLSAYLLHLLQHVKNKKSAPSYSVCPGVCMEYTI